jgi:hypothetical protein
MYTVTYSYYNKYNHEKQFASYDAARKFWYYIQKKQGVTRTLLESVQ